MAESLRPRDRPVPMNYLAQHEVSEPSATSKAPWAALVVDDDAACGSR